MNTERVEWPFTTKRHLRRTTWWAFQVGFQSGVDRSAEALLMGRAGLGQRVSRPTDLPTSVTVCRSCAGLLNAMPETA